MQINDAMVAKAAEALRLCAIERGHPVHPAVAQHLAVAAITAALAEMWQGIETAPKDGSEFLGFGGGVEGDKGIQTVRWCEIVGCWETPTASLEDWDNQAEGYSRPTHFMPLPAPPRGK